MIDLHSHTTASDGQYSPADLVRRARKAGISILAVTDHDTVAGLAEAKEAAERQELLLVPGIELSVFIRDREAHLLGHFIDPALPELRDLSRRLRAQRDQRMAEMIARLAELGLPCALDDVVRASSGKNLGRPHLARVMVDQGYVKSVPEAFERFIGVGRPAYADRFRLLSREAISLVRRAGGTATLAHAHLNKVTPDEIAQLKREGLAGLEVSHPDHSPEVREVLRTIAHELDLVPTAGSDYHGEEVSPGRHLSSHEMHASDFARLWERAAHRIDVPEEPVKNP